jgi:restriction system protein
MARISLSSSFSTSFGKAEAIGMSTTIKFGRLVTDTPIVLQAVVEQIGDAPEGFLIRTLEPAWREISTALARDPGLLTSLGPRQWEELIAASYDKAGFDEVVLTPRSGDFGRDVIAIRRGWGSIRIIDQVKAFSPGHVVTANDVRALLGVLGSDRNATKGVVTTTSTFAPRIVHDPFIAPYIPYRLELVDGAALEDRLKRLCSDGDNAEPTR